MKTNPIKTNIQHRLPKKPGKSRKSGWGEVRAWVPGVSAVLLIGMVVREVQKRKQLNQERERDAVQEGHRLTGNQERATQEQEQAKQERERLLKAKHQHQRDQQQRYKRQLQKEEQEQQKRLHQLIDQMLGGPGHQVQQQQQEQQEAEHEQQEIERCNEAICRKKKCEKDEFRIKFIELIRKYHTDKGGDEEIAKYLNVCNGIINPKPTQN